MKLFRFLPVLCILLPISAWAIVDPGGTGGGTDGGDSGGDTDTGTPGEVYTITLNTDLEWRLPYPEYVFYVKHSKGFSNQPNGYGVSVSGEWSAARKLSELGVKYEPYVHAQYDLLGFYRNDDKYIEPDGSFTDILTNTVFSGNTTLTAKWEPKDYIVEYYCRDFRSSSTPVTRTCTYEADCFVESLDSIFGASCTPPDGYLFTQALYCYQATSTSAEACANYDYEEPLAVGSKLYDWGRPLYHANQYKLVPELETCPAGYYCTGGIKDPCPVGTTSAAGSSKETDCTYQGGDTGTKFCDKTGQCFTLPADVTAPIIK